MMSSKGELDNFLKDFDNVSDQLSLWEGVSIPANDTEQA